MKDDKELQIRSSAAELIVERADHKTTKKKNQREKKTKKNTN